MDEKVLQFRVGVVVVAAVIITVFLVFVFGEGQRVLQGQYTIYMRFPQAPGVTVDTPIRKNGVLIGRVTRVELEDNGVLLTAKIDKNRRLRRSEVCRIGTATFLGDAVIEFLLPGENELFNYMDVNRDGVLDEAERARANEYILDQEFTSEGIVSSNPLTALTNLEPDVRSAIRNFDSAAFQMSTLFRNFNNIVGDGGNQVQRLSQKTEEAVERFSRMTESINRTVSTIDELVSDPEIKASIKRSLGEFPRVIGEAQNTLVQARDAFTNFQKVSQRAETNLANLEPFSEALGRRGEQLLESVERSLRNVDEVLAQLSEFSQSLNSADGTLGRLVHDRELYDHVTRTAANVEDLTRRIRPVVDDIRVFSDKLARDPSQLGISGAIRRTNSSNIKPR